MFLKKSCVCAHCDRSFECTGAFGPNGARYISGTVAWMKLISREPGRLLLEGNTICAACMHPHRFLVEYDSDSDRYNDVYVPAAKPETVAEAPARRKIGRIVPGQLRKLHQV
ncbi:hypothetical protein CDO73_20745 [Saccharibacillus sp. O23]|uniref:hypothetical protein n=1 Tax=Saccharibacillus sp. O23 TaxID=2009338 RepID=UPI000B4E2754|nr:hypothetical protein [Saccharibacillus sp. O23]OWR27939.1 hypothetical protein CDO73_20745 [Saccharibacillus sp. O23]